MPDSLRVVFPYFAQLHQVLHSLPIAAEMAARHPDVEVHVAGRSAAHLSFIRRLLAEHAPAAPVRLKMLWGPPFGIKLGKRRRMLLNLRYLRSFDAIVTPERTSLAMLGMGLGRTRLIWTRHGAGDRQIGFAPDVHRFDYVLLAGPRIEQRLLADRLIRRGCYASGIYAKLDWLKSASAAPLFENGRPTVLYSPHFEPQLSSWPAFGMKVLDYFAGSRQYNLIFAPHLRLFDPVTAEKRKLFERYAGLSHMRIDLGSERSCDMTYTRAADLYLGDVSSQVAEFVCRPRPCLFLNAHRVAWRDDPNYGFWTLGPVIDDIAQLDVGLEQARADHSRHVEAQRRYVADAFGAAADGHSAARGADAIVAFIAGTHT